jgi:hypothetical protein
MDTSSTIDDMFRASSIDGVSKLLDLIKKFESDCDDCDSVKSPCCNEVVTYVFGSMPLDVKCTACNKEYSLRSILKD